jgi:ATP-binding cassette subfamily F protein uup
MPLVSIENLSIGYRGPALLDSVSCRIDAGERIGLLGRNGAGKTTLMRILSGQEQPDHGTVAFAPGARAALLPQDVPRELAGPIRQVVAAGLPVTNDEAVAWKQQQQVEQILSRMKLDGQAQVEQLSSGMKRRVLLARSIVSAPDLLLLDEPTNHLDIEAIRWLEEFLQRWKGALMFVTHDRSFLRRLATRILEIDRGRLFDWSCDYDTFLARKDAALAAEEKQQALFDKKLAEEEAWIRTGIKARRTRNQGRVRALEALRREHQARRTKIGSSRLTIQEGQRSGDLAVLIDQISFAYDDDRPIVTKFSTTIMRGDKVGIIGRNGAGKTTLLRLLLGQLAPQRGTVKLGTNLQIAYFDQLREQLREEATVQENVGDGYETVTINGKSQHVIGYLQDFLFTPERVRTEVRYLSGGERNRILLAKLFAKPANVIVLDEPTNDLDTETLELLEQRLVEYQGTVLLVSHDRTFLNNVVTSTIVFEDGNVREYAGGYDDWMRQRAAAAGSPLVNATGSGGGPRAPATPAAEPESKSTTARASTAKRRLKFQEKQELATLPGTIERLEAAIAELQQLLAQPGFYQQPGDTIAREQARLKQSETELSTAYARWEELEALAEDSG